MPGLPAFSSQKEERTGLRESVPKVRAEMNLVADSVITTWTSAPAFRNSLVKSAAL